MRYRVKHSPTRRRWPRRVIWVLLIAVALVLLATVTVRHVYNENLKAVSMSERNQMITIPDGATVNQIADQLKRAGLIRSSWAFTWYVSSKEVRDALQAGTYSLRPSQNIPEIVAQLTHGKVATNLVTILPGQRLDQVKQSLISAGFKEVDVQAALDSANYADNSALVDKPAGASLEGYLYPDSYQKSGNTSAQSIIRESLDEMQKRLTPDLRAAFAKEGLSTYQGIILASIVEQEVAKPSDRAQAAQVFLKRIQLGMALGSDVTAYYGAILAGHSPSTSFDSPYNTLLHQGLPPTPISNVNDNSLQAAAHPAPTDWLYFVSGDDGNTYFSKTFQEHQALTQQYCHKLCGQN